MRSSKRCLDRIARQGGFGLVDVLVGVGLLGVAIVVLLGSLSALLVGARMAERRTVETRLARNEIELIMAQPPATCPSLTSKTVTIDATTYTIRIDCSKPVRLPGLVEFSVRVSDPSGASLMLTNERVRLSQ